MSNRYQGGINRPGYNPLKVANAPTIGTATAASSTSVSVTFTAPSCVGGGAISSYTAYANCGIKTASGTSSPLTVSCLTAGTAYTFQVIATNAYGPSYPSAASNSATPPVQGQQAYTTAGTYSWVAPTGVTSVSVVAVGPGSYAGGGLGYKNNITVTPGSSYTVVVGTPGKYYGGGGTGGGATDSYFCSTSVVKGGGGGAGTSGGCYAGGTYTGDGGGNGGIGGPPPRGAGGAGGYSGAGGRGGQYANGVCGAGFAGAACSGAGGGGGGRNFCNYGSGAGGGVGILGKGATGAGGSRATYGGSGGSGGCAGGNGYIQCCSGRARAGGLYGGGGGLGSGSGTSGCGGGGAVRIIWPGTTRSFPSTNTGDL